MGNVAVIYLFIYFLLKEGWIVKMSSAIGKFYFSCGKFRVGDLRAVEQTRKILKKEDRRRRRRGGGSKKQGKLEARKERR